MQTSYIINCINQNFAKVYKNATPFVNSGTLWQFCIDTIKDPVSLSCIVFANDMGVPPMASLMLFYQRQQNPPSNFQFAEKERQRMGALMGFVFKHVLGYQKQNDRCKVNCLGVQNAARFLDGPVHQFTL